MIDKSDLGLLAGQLLHKVKIQRRIDTQSASGAPITTWADFAAVWAKITALTGKEYQRAEQMQSGVQYTCDIRWVDGVLPSMRILFKGVAYNIQAVLPDPRFTRTITLMLEAGVNQG